VTATIGGAPLLVPVSRPALDLLPSPQVLFESSEEEPSARGLGFLGGHVVKFRLADPHLKVPHIGWNSVVRTERDAHEPLLAGLGAEPYAYFGPWTPRAGDFWNAPFGALRPASDLPDVGSVLAFFTEGRPNAWRLAEWRRSSRIVLEKNPNFREVR